MSWTDEVSRTHQWGRSAMESIMKHGLAATPECYMVWYNYHAGYLRALQHDLSDALSKTQAITDDTIAELYERHFTTKDELKAIEDASLKIDRALVELEREVYQTNRQSASYRGVLNDIDNRLTDDDGTRDRISVIVEELQVETRKMSKQTALLEQQLDTSSGEVATLKNELNNARREANTDPLTGLANRRCFEMELARQAEDAMCEHGPLILFMIDVDFFKSYNDRFGHQVGDIILKFIAKTIAEALGPSATVARYGGEEFAVLLSEDWLEGAIGVAENIRMSIAAHRIILRRQNIDVGTVTISIGAAEYRHGEPPSSLIHRSDRALYAAKKLGRNRVITELDMPEDIGLPEIEFSDLQATSKSAQR